MENKNSKIIIILLVLVLIIGGFILYLIITDNNLLNKNNDNQIEDVNKDDENSNELAGGPYIEGDNFYIPSWGVKLKLSDQLTKYGYSVKDETIGLTAMFKKDIQTSPQAQYYSDINNCAFITIFRTKIEPGTNLEYRIKVSKIGEYYYIIDKLPPFNYCPNQEHGLMNIEYYDTVIDEMTKYLTLEEYK